MRTKKNANADTKKRLRWTFAPSGVSRCVLCGEACRAGAGAKDADRMELGHIVAEANGGEFVYENLAPMCRACNDALGDNDADPATFHYDAHATYPLVTLRAAQALARDADDAYDAEQARRVALWKR